MRTCGRTVSITLMTVSLACASAGRRTPVAQPFTLKIVLSKPGFFAGEPIYGLFELRNVSPDTVRIPPFGFNSGWLKGVLHRANGSVVPGGRSAYVDYACRETCNWDPVAPGAARYFPLIAQEYWGEQGELTHATFHREIEPGAYTLDGSFELDRVPGATPAVASPVAFHVRPRRAAEDTVYEQFSRLAAVDVRAWTVADLDSSLAWISRRLAADSADPLALDMLLLSDVRTAVKDLPVDSTAWPRILQLELAIAKA